MAGCAAGTVKPPLELPAHQYRPTILDREDRITDEGVAWLEDIVNTHLRNCVVLSTMRGESVSQCRRGIDRPPKKD